ncbi:MAG: hypothetical protein ACRED5_13620 [Propylenella sp.]
MQRFTSALGAAAISVAALATAAPAGAASIYAPPAATAANDSDAGILRVHDRRWRDRGPHFSFGFGVPFAPRAYAYDRRYDDRCPYGSYYRYPVGCVATYRHYDGPYYYDRGPGVSFHFGF